MKKILLFLGITITLLGIALILFQNVASANVPEVVKVENIKDGECVIDDTHFKMYRLDNGVVPLDENDWEYKNSFKFSDKNAELYKWGVELDEFFDKDISYYKIPQFIQYNNKQFPVTKIGPNAFEGCKNLKNIIISEGVEVISYEAFKGCSALTEIKIPASVEYIAASVFEGCPNISSISFAEGTKINGMGSGSEGIYYPPFPDCPKVKSLVIPGSARNVNFDGLIGLENVTILEGNPDFEGSFRDCSNLTSVKLPNGLKRIPNFEYCINLKTIELPNSITFINYRAFADCENLESITLPPSVEEIKDGAFGWCSSLTTVYISNGVKTIGEGAFKKCVSLTSINIPNSVETIGYNAFENCSSLQSIVLPNSIIEIDNYAFQDCTSLKNVQLPNSLERIGAYLFAGCKNLTSITIPKGVKIIGNHAFENCKSLSAVSIPRTVERIDFDTFEGCDGLKTITIPAKFKNELKDIFYDVDLSKVKITYI
ncbi:MAG: leucine-rich repeat domain-containing protein [Muribaculaceae bacterium]|nr:leucine-rich repeat domain-containing protein [Muribaculaceae bacterium]